MLATVNMPQTIDKRAAEGFASAWDEFVLAIRRSQARGQQSPQDLTLAQYYLLSPLERETAVPLCQLAESAAIAPPTATRIVDGLEKAGVLRRERSRTDRRTVLVSLTPQGRKRIKSKRLQLARRRRRLYEQLEPGEREQSERLLRHLAELVGQL
jgi:MarR family transcriptional regulator, organic hydroperoxide resistance regulator